MTTQPPARGRGRPRPAATIARDETIYTLLADGPLARSALVQHTGLSADLVYLALARLRDDGRIRQCLRDGVIVWSHNDGTPCP